MMTRRFRLLSAILLSAGALVGCGNKSSEPHSPAPLLDFECSIATVGAPCAPGNGGVPLIVGLTETLDFDCEFRMALYSGDDLLHHFDYISLTNMEDRGTYLLGVTEHWMNSVYAPVISIPERTFRVCAMIDLNNNGRLDFGEPLHSSTYTVGETFQPFSTWEVP